MNAVHRSLLAVAIAGLVLLYGGPADAVPVQCGTEVNGLICGQIVAEDFVDWGQLGGIGTTFDGNDPGGTYPPPPAQSKVFIDTGGALGIQVTLDDPGKFFTRRDQRPLGTTGSYSGNFDSDAHLLLNGTNVGAFGVPNGPVTIEFENNAGVLAPVRGAGVHLQLNAAPGGGHFAFTGIITAFDSLDNELASFFNPEGDSCMANIDLTQQDCPLGSALFLGIGVPVNDLSPPRITRIVVDVRSGRAGSGAEALLLPEGNFAFNDLLIGAVPEPASLVLVGVGLMGVSAVARWRRR